MRLWSIHPKYLDTKGLVALWREALGAQKALVAYLKNEKCGYQNHPQLDRFKKGDRSLDFMSMYLHEIYLEASNRMYNFNYDKIIFPPKYSKDSIAVTNEQLKYEFNHLLEKLKTRDHKQYLRIKDVETIRCHPLFRVIVGDIEDWEKVK